MSILASEDALCRWRPIWTCVSSQRTATRSYPKARTLAAKFVRRKSRNAHPVRRHSHACVKRFAANAHSAKRPFNRRWTRYGGSWSSRCAGKIFLDASSEERAHRRMLQLQEYFSVNFERLLAEIKERRRSPVIALCSAVSSCC